MNTEIKSCEYPWIKEIMESIKNLSTGNLEDRITPSERSDCLGRIMDSLKILVEKRSVMDLKSARVKGRIDELIDVFKSIASLDFTKRASVTAENSVLDMFAAAINYLIENLRDTVLSREYIMYLSTLIDEAIIILKPDKTILRCTQPVLDIFGYKNEELIGRPATSVFPEELFNGSLFDELKKKKVIKDTEITCRTKDGRKIVVSWTISLITNKHDESQNTVCVARDISRIKKVEYSRQESEEKFQVFMETASDYMFMLNREGEFTYVNESMVRALGYSKEEMAGMNIALIIEKDFFKRVREPQSEELIKRGKIILEVALRTKAGKRIYTEAVVVAVYDQDGRFTGSRGVFRDITGRKRAEDALRRSGEQLKTIYSLVRQLSADFSIDSVLKSALDGILEAVHPDLSMIFLRDGSRLYLRGVGPPEARHGDGKKVEVEIGECLCGIAVEEGRAIYSGDIFNDPRCTREECKKHGYHSFAALPLRIRDEGVGVLGLASREGRNFEGQAEFLEVLSNEIAAGLQNALLYEEVRRHEAELEGRVIERTVQLEAANRELETFSYSVSHDLRAPLRHISGYVSLLERSASALDEKSRRYIGVIKESTERMDTLVDDLLEFSRMGRAEVHRSGVDLRELVEEVREELKSDMEGRKVEWVMGELPLVYGDRTLLRQVMMNFISNAVKYTREREVARIEIKAEESVGDGKTVVSVRDNGVGFDMEYVHKLFTVFQRLHPADEFEGEGIGLATVRRIINRHGGRVWAEGKVDEGAVFYFSLPHET